MVITKELKCQKGIFPQELDPDHLTLWNNEQIRVRALNSTEQSLKSNIVYSIPKY